MPQLTPQEWSRQANELQKQAGRPLDRADLEKKLGKPDGKVTRGQSLKKGGSWKPRTGDRGGQGVRRGRGERTYTTDTARENAAQTRAQAREQSQSTLHQHVHGDKPSIGEHGQNIASGGIGDDLDSVSDPYFKEFKDNAESKIRAQYGDQYVVDINEVTGYIRVIPRQYYNKQQYRSQQPGFDLEPHMDLDQVVTGLPFIVAQNLGLTNTEFPTEQQPGLQTTAGKAQWKPPALPGFDASEQPGPTVTAPQGGGYYAPQVMETNGNGNGNGYENGNGNGNGGSYSNGNGNGNGNGSYVDQLIDFTKENEPTFKTAQDAMVVFRAGKAVWNVGAATVSALGALAGVGNP